MLETLLHRNSHPALTNPGPSSDELDRILAAGLQAPDHGRLRPWRFVVIEGERRQAFGEVLRKSLHLAGQPTPAQEEKALGAPLRAPLIIAGLLNQKPSDKVPRAEQLAAVAAALYGMQLAAEAMGYGNIWRTGTYAQDPHVVSALGGASGDEVVGFLYIGTRIGEPKSRGEDPLADVVSFF